jgi:hypothetical protein
MQTAEIFAKEFDYATKDSPDGLAAARSGTLTSVS